MSSTIPGEHFWIVSIVDTAWPLMALNQPPLGSALSLPDACGARGLIFTSVDSWIMSSCRLWHTKNEETGSCNLLLECTRRKAWYGKRILGQFVAGQRASDEKIAICFTTWLKFKKQYWYRVNPQLALLFPRCIQMPSHLALCEYCFWIEHWKGS